jgi:Ca2+-binding RTX toxin-like protein
MALTSTVQKELYQFFTIAFDAAPGATYMGQLADAVNAGMTVKQVVNVFTTKPEFTSVYPTFMTNEQFATRLVDNVVGDSASAAAKLSAVADISAALTAGWSRGDVIYQVFTNLANKPSTDATWGGTAVQMANQVAYAQYYTERDTVGVTNLATLRGVIANVTKDSSTTDAAIAAALAPADTTPTYALSAGVASANEGQSIVFTISTTNVAAGSSVNYYLSGVSASDVVGGALSGTATVDATGKAIVVVSLVEDALTEGGETITMTAASKTASVTVTDTSTTPVVVPPTYAVSAGAATVNEGSSITFTITTTNVAAGSTVNYSLSGVSASDVVGGSLSGTATVDATGKAVVVVSLVEDALTEGAETITMTAAGNTASVTISDTSKTPVVDVAPEFSAATRSVSVAENQTTVSTLVATDSNGDTITYTITGGSDASKFSINATTGAMSFKDAPNFEAPGSAAGTNTYDVEVTATANGKSDQQNVTVSVTNANEAPSLSVPSLTPSVAENTTQVAVLSTTDVDASDAATYRLTGDDAALFVVADGVLSFRSAPNFEAPGSAAGTNTYSVTVTAVDAGGLTSSKSLTVSVTNVSETSSSALTAGIDTVSTPAADRNIVDASSEANSLGTSDSITDASGTDSDTLVAKFTTASNVRPTISNIETISVESIAVNSTLDLTRASGYDVLRVEAATQGIGNMTFSNVGSADVTLEVVQLASNNVSLNFTDEALAAASQTATLVVDSVTGGTVKLNDAGGSNKLETLALQTTTGASNFTLEDAGVGLTNLNITGSKNLTLAVTTGTSLTSVNASALTGNLNISGTYSSAGVTITGGSGVNTITDGAGNDVIYGGAGNDTISVVTGYDTVYGGDGADTFNVTSASNVAAYGGAGNDIFNLSVVFAGDTVSGGDGTDTLNVNQSMTAGAFAGVSGIESIVVTSTTSIALNSADQAGISGATFDLTSATNQSVTLDSTITGGSVRFLLGSGVDTDSVNASASAASITVSGNANYFDAVDSLIGGNGSSDALSITADGATADLTNVSKFESLVVGANGVSDIGIDLGTYTTALTVDARALTSSSADMTLLAGSASGNLTIYGGSGADVVTAGTGVDYMSGGAGGDTFIFAAGRFTSADSVIGGDGTDTISLGDSGSISAGTTRGIDSSIEILALTANSSISFNSADVSGITLDFSDGDNQSLVVGSTFAGSVNVNLGSDSGDNDSISAGSSAASITVSGNGDWFNAGDSITGGNGTADALSITADGATAALGNNINGVENINVTANGASTLTLALGTASTALMIDADAMTNSAAVLTVEAANYAGALTISAGSAADSITTGSGNDVVYAGAGNDSIRVGNGADVAYGGEGADTITVVFTGNVALHGEAGADTFAFGSYLTSGDTVSGGDGTDTLTISGAYSTAGAFTNVRGVETVSITGSSSLTVNSADVTALSSATISLADSDNQSVTVSAGFTGGLSFALGSASGDNDSISAGSSAASITVSGNGDWFNAGDSITGGNGTADALSITADGATAALGNNINGVENINVTANGASTLTLALGTASTALMIDADAMTNSAAVLTVEAANYAGALTISAGSAADSITTGSGNDVVYAGAGNDSIRVGNGADVAYGGEGADTITVVFTGNVALHGEAGADTFAFGSYLTSGDTVSGGDGTDTLTISGAYSTAGAFTNVRGVETVSITGSSSLTVNSADVTALSSATISLADSDNQSVTVSAGFTGGLSFALGSASGDNDSISAGSSAASITVSGNGDWFNAGDSITGGNGTADALSITADGATAALGNNINGVENINVTANGASTLTLALGTASTALMIDADAMTNSAAVLTVEAANYAGALTISAGSAADSITTGSGNDVVYAGAGNDSIRVGNGADVAYGGEGADTITVVFTGNVALHGEAGADTFAFGSYLTSGDTVSGGDGTDTLTISGAYSTAGAFTNVRGVETVSITGSSSLTLGTADLTGLSGTTISLADSNNQTVNFGSGSRAFSGNLTIDVTGDVGGNDSITTNMSTGTVTITGNVSNIEAGDSITAGGSSSDVIVLKADGGTAVLTNVRGFTSITVNGNGSSDATLTLGTDSETLSINALGASGMSNTSADLTVGAGNYTGALTIVGSAGNNNVTGGTFSTRVTTGAGQDSVTGGSGVDSIYTYGGNDTIIVGSTGDYVEAGDGVDSITASAGGDVEINAGAGNDTITFGSALTSADTLIGGDGTDTLNIATAANGSFVNVSGIESVVVTGTSTVDLGANDLSIAGKSFDLTNTNNQTVTVYSGFTGSLSFAIGSGTDNDKVDASASSAVITVTGNATYFDAGDSLAGGNGSSDTLVLVADGSANLTQVSGFEIINISGNATSTQDVSLAITGSTDLTITATSMSNSSADLTITSSSLTGDVTLSAGSGADSITAGSGTDSLYGFAGNDTLNLGSGDDFADGGADNDDLIGGAGADTLSGGLGQDSLTGGTGADALYGGTGNDTFFFDVNGVVSVDTVFDLELGNSSSAVDVLSFGSSGSITWGNTSAINWSSAGLEQNYSIIVLNEASYASLGEAGSYADQLFDLDGNSANDSAGSYMFVWQDTSGVIHVSYGESATGSDTFKDVVKVELMGSTTDWTDLLAKLNAPDFGLRP